MHKAMWWLVAGVFISALVSQGVPAKSEVAAGVRIEVRNVAVLPHLGDRYRSLSSLPDSDYRIWQLDVGGSVSQQVVPIPEQSGSRWIEVLVVARNNTRRTERIRFDSPRLQLANGESATPWEVAFAGMGNREGLAKALQLSATPPMKRVLHVATSGSLYCNLDSQQETWLALIFQIPDSAQEGTFSIGGNTADPIRFPLSTWAPASPREEDSRGEGLR